MTYPLYNPFLRYTFWGREKDLSIITGRLQSDPPQSIPIIGEPHIGKTSLVRHLMHLYQLHDQQTAQPFIFVYLDCLLYNRLVEDYLAADEQKLDNNISNFAAARFWWDLYYAMPGHSLEDNAFPQPKRSDGDNVLIDTAYEIKTEIERFIRSQRQKVIFIFDNFEGIATLPLRNSDWLRSIVVLTYKCAYIATSRYLLYILYRSESKNNLSPLWNIFSDPVYLGLFSEQEADAYLEQARKLVMEHGITWEPRDIEFIRNMAGRHPELLHIACARLFEENLSSQSASNTRMDIRDTPFLSLRIIQDTSPICKQLWEGLTNPELSDRPNTVDAAKETRFQQALLDIAHGRTPSDDEVLSKLEQRGLIEYRQNALSIFCEVMRAFVLKQEQMARYTNTGMASGQVSLPSSNRALKEDDKPFTYKEGLVYEYLKAHLGEVCDRDEIMRAVWKENDNPSESALQKIIERIRNKIEDDPNSPYKLISVRGRGYMLRREL